MSSVLVVSAAAALPSRAAAADDDDDDDDDSSSTKWPNSSSPLPTFKDTVGNYSLQQNNNDASLNSPTSDSSESSASPAPPLPMSDLERALEQAKKQKRVGPLTHG
jgi:hypothetical protein